MTELARLLACSVAALTLAAAPALVSAQSAPVASPQAATANAVPAQPPAAASAADVGSLDAILAALYDVISGPAGAPRNWDRFRSLFAPGARLMPLQTRPGAATEARVLAPADYVEIGTRNFAKIGFYERETARRTETYGALTHVWSTYESKHAPGDPTPFARGINSIQLMNDSARWWILTVAWQAERPDLPLPQQYLK